MDIDTEVLLESGMGISSSGMLMGMVSWLPDSDRTKLMERLLLGAVGIDRPGQRCKRLASGKNAADRRLS